MRNRQVRVIRIGHRSGRDVRITTHVCLVARALGASEVVVCGEPAREVVSSVERISEKWGKGFKARYDPSWRKAIKRAPGEALVHLTMYGKPIQERIGEIRQRERVAVIVGAEKVPSEVYEGADYNVAVTNQPHSEVAALAIFLDRYFEGRELNIAFKNAQLRIIPTADRKLVEEKIYKGVK